MLRFARPNSLEWPSKYDVRRRVRVLLRLATRALNTFGQ